jgi:hypothetical protein
MEQEEAVSCPRKDFSATVPRPHRLQVPWNIRRRAVAARGQATRSAHGTVPAGAASPDEGGSLHTREVLAHTKTDMCACLAGIRT